MKQIQQQLSLAVFICAILWVNGCAPVFSDLQSARTVPKGKVQLTPSFSSVSFTEDGETEKVQNVFGGQLAIGVHESSEFRLAFARVDFPEGTGVNVFGFGPKFSIVKDQVAFYLPVGFAFGEGIEVSETWDMHPTVIFTTLPHQNIEINPSAKVLIALNSDRDTLLAFNLGLGLSNNFERWAIRPEIGILVNPGESGFFTAYSVGISLTPSK